MGVSISEIVSSKTIDLDALRGQIIAVDTFNFLYQFLATIRGPDGSPLTNARGQITSHLIGLISRTTNLMGHGIKFVFVIDGETPQLKQEERKRRKQLKEDAQKEYEVAKEQGDYEAMKKFASRTSRLTPAMLEDAKEIIDLLGLPIVQAPMEGEAQAAAMAAKGDVDAIASQDFDSLLFGAPRVIRNLSITGRRRVAGKQAYTQVLPAEVTLQDVLDELQIDREQLVILGILVGTDFNYGGVKGIGPKKALKLLAEHGHDFDKIFEKVEWGKHFDTDWRSIQELFHKMPFTADYDLCWNDPQTDKLSRLLVDKHGFDQDRTDRMLSALAKQQEASKQKGLSDFFS